MVALAFDAHTMTDEQPYPALLLPRWLRRDAFEARATAEGLEVVESFATFGTEELERDVPVWILIPNDGEPHCFTLADVARLLGAEAKWLQRLPAVHDTVVLPTFMPNEAHARVRMVVSESLDKAINQRVNYKAALAAYEKILRRLHALYGNAFRLHLRYDGDVVYPEPTDAWGTINLFVNMRPPGDGMAVNRSEVFGLAIGSSASNGWVCQTPAHGVGTVVKDSKDVPVVQLVGRNAYLLAPLFNPFNQWSSERIFWRLMHAVFDGLKLEAARIAAGPTQPDLEDLAAEASKWVLNWADSVAALCDKTTQEVRNLRELLTMKSRELRELESARAFVEGNDFMQEAVARMPDDFRRIMAMPEVARVWVADGGIHVETKDIVIEHGERRFLIGPLVIRMSSVGHVHVWSDNPLGPDKAPHPHVDRYEDPCFGNAGKFAKLLGEHRYADALETILAWLTRGYSPELTQRKIELWPEIDSQGKILPPEPVETIEIDRLDPCPVAYRLRRDEGLDGMTIAEPSEPEDESLQEEMS